MVNISKNTAYIAY